MAMKTQVVIFQIVTCYNQQNHDMNEWNQFEIDSYSLWPMENGLNKE